MIASFQGFFCSRAIGSSRHPVVGGCLPFVTRCFAFVARARAGARPRFGGHAPALARAHDYQSAATAKKACGDDFMSSCGKTKEERGVSKANGTVRSAWGQKINGGNVTTAPINQHKN